MAGIVTRSAAATRRVGKCRRDAMNQISESDFLEVLQDGTKRTTDFMAHLTEYHGGPIKTEYILTADIARAFLVKGHEVRVEKINRHLVNGLTKRKGWKPRRKFGAQRSDVAVTNTDLGSGPID